MFTPDPAAGGNPANAAPLVYCIYADHLNTPRAVVDTAGNLRWSWVDEPFGTTAANSNPAGQGTFIFNLRFPGQFYDAESGMHYNVNRDYVPGVGRYAQSDPVGLGGGINTYSYADGNPPSKTDPKGLLAIPSAPMSSPTRPNSEPEMSLRPDMCAASPYDNANIKCQAECLFELDMPGRKDNFGPYRACLRRCLAKRGFAI